MGGPHSFSELREALPELSAKVLTERLTELVDQGLANRETLPGFPARTSYHVTATGRELRPLLVELYRTGSALLSR